ncbi:hypothetical protein C2G38_2053573 [Gigaspora rosea]|uniref:Uncharacterized protein n=1 Tax=Gigaspora rosea TaxID=44941 RepID=A0A397WC93_9GLOM|nr:hypothetical protein C2G38_2053573 [Gigaspora rosea]
MKAHSLYYFLLYKNVSYTTLKPDGNYHNVKLKVGEIVKIIRFGENEPTFGQIIKYVFLCFDWLENLNKWNSLLECPIYRIQHNSLDWVYPISTVLHSSSISFIHYCNSNCSFQQHDTTNSEYIRNDFFFVTI